MAVKKTPTRAKSPSSHELHSSHEAIAVRAYEIFMGRGGVHGRDLEHWFEAERQLMEESQKPPTKRKISKVAVPVA